MPLAGLRSPAGAPADLGWLLSSIGPLLTESWAGSTTLAGHVHGQGHCSRRAGPSHSHACDSGAAPRAGIPTRSQRVMLLLLAYSRSRAVLVVACDATVTGSGVSSSSALVAVGTADDITPSVLRRHRHRQRPLVLGATPPEAASHPRCDATVTGSGVSSSSPRARIAIGKADDASLLPVPASAIRTTKILLLLRPRKIQGRQVRTHRIKTNAKSPQDTFPDTARSSPISFARIRPGSCLGMLTKMSK